MLNTISKIFGEKLAGCYVTNVSLKLSFCSRLGDSANKFLAILEGSVPVYLSASPEPCSRGLSTEIDHGSCFE